MNNSVPQLTAAGQPAEISCDSRRIIQAPRAVARPGKDPSATNVPFWCMAAGDLTDMQWLKGHILRASISASEMAEMARKNAT